MDEGMTQAVRHQIQILRSRGEIEAFRGFWNSCGPARDADLDFFLFIVDSNPQTLRPHVVMLYEDGAPTALLIGRLDASHVPVRVGYLSLPVPKMRVLQFVHGGCLGAVSSANAKLLVGSIIDSLAANEADIAVFQHFDLCSPLVSCARSLPRWLCSDHVAYPDIHRIRDLSEETGPFLARLSKKERYHQRNRVRKISENFRSSRIEVFGTPDRVARLVRDAESVVRKSYQRGLGVGFSDTPLIRARLEFEAQKGWLRASVLYLDDQPCACWIGSLRNGVFLSDYLAFDPKYFEYAPGLYLMVKVIEELCGELRDGSIVVKRIDFGIGDASYKERLSNLSRQESTICIFAPTTTAVSVNVFRSIAALVNYAAKALVRTTPLLGTIKRIWRTRATANK
jgi:Acetyltransferase (GNAT) domain